LSGKRNPQAADLFYKRRIGVGNRVGRVRIVLCMPAGRPLGGLRSAPCL